LIQRDGYAVMLNLGAGMVIFGSERVAAGAHGRAADACSGLWWRVQIQRKRWRPSSRLRRPLCSFR
jgi:hypothetical protein